MYDYNLIWHFCWYRISYNYKPAQWHTFSLKAEDCGAGIKVQGVVQGTVGGGMSEADIRRVSEQRVKLELLQNELKEQGEAICTRN